MGPTAVWILDSSAASDLLQLSLASLADKFSSDTTCTGGEGNVFPVNEATDPLLFSVFCVFSG